MKDKIDFKTIITPGKRKDCNLYDIKIETFCEGELVNRYILNLGIQYNDILEYLEKIKQEEMNKIEMILDFSQKALME